MYEETTSPSRGTPTGSPPQSVVDEEEIKVLEQEELATQVYRDLWNNFYTWEYDSYARRYLEDLSRCLPGLPPPPWRGQENGPQYHVATGRSNDNDEFEFEVHDFEPHHVSFNLKQKHRPIKPPQHIPLYPRYSACTPISQTLGSTDPYTLANTLHFIPLADDPKFEPEMKELVETTNYLAWQTDFKDPDGNSTPNTSFAYLIPCIS